MDQDESREALLKIVRDFLVRLPEEKQDKILELLSSSLSGQLLNNYFRAVEDVKKNKKLSKQEKLRGLLSPIIDLNKLINPLAENPYRRDFPWGESLYPFVSETISLERDLDLKNLHPDPSKYRIELEEGRHLDPADTSIFLRSEFERYLALREECKAKGEEPPPVQLDAGYLSLRDIWKEWLPTLTQEIIRRNDLLVQVLVVYTIKRALNGDEKAVAKLYDLYEHTAQAIAVKTAMKLGVMREFEDIKQDAGFFLQFLLSGFRPEHIVRSLLEDSTERAMMSLPPWVADFYIRYFGEYVPERTKGLLKEAEEKERLIQFAEGLSTGKLSVKNLGKVDQETINWLKEKETISALRDRRDIISLELAVLFSPYTPIRSSTLWKNSPKLVRRFNNYSYRPSKMGPQRNLTTWLFGTRKDFQYGKLFQLLKDKYKPMIRQKKKDKFLDIEDIPSPQPSDEQMEKDPDEIVERLVDLGVSERDAKILTDWRFQKLTQGEIGRKNNLSERQIRNICRKVEAFIPSQ
jgi:hypothetical protein